MDYSIYLCNLTMGNYIGLKIMGTLELKLSLIQRLSLINDDDLLHRIKSLIDRMEERQALRFSPEVKVAIKHAREDISEGRFIEDEGLDRYMERWVNES